MVQAHFSRRCPWRKTIFSQVIRSAVVNIFLQSTAYLCYSLNTACMWWIFLWHYLCWSHDWLAYHCPKRMLTSSDTIHQKLLLLKEATDVGVKIWFYYSVNGAFSSKQFRVHCTALHQSFSFSGVSAHHQHGYWAIYSNYLQYSLGACHLEVVTTKLATCRVYHQFTPCCSSWSPEELKCQTKSPCYRMMTR